MPIYEYQCTNHGIFELLRAMAESSEPGQCPDCSKFAPRILSAPRLSAMSASDYQAHARNEKSRHEPTVRNKNDHDHSQHGHGHKGHGHAGHSHAKPKSGQLQRYTGARPWVMEHG